jgi:hypothetical protein
MLAGTPTAKTNQDWFPSPFSRIEPRTSPKALAHRQTSYSLFAPPTRQDLEGVIVVRLRIAPEKGLRCRRGEKKKRGDVN